MFNISGIQREVWYQGNRVRSRRIFFKTLKTRQGVIRYIKELLPIEKIAIFEDAVDVTESFIKEGES